jgi:hypothetical protein
MDVKGRSLIDYFKRNMAKGYSPKSLKWALINQNYPRSSVEKAFVAANREIEAERESKKASEKPKIKYQLYGADNKPIRIKEPFSRKIKRLFGLGR